MIPHLVFLFTILDYFMCLDYATLYLWRFLFYFEQSTKLLKKWIFYPYRAFIFIIIFLILLTATKFEAFCVYKIGFSFFKTRAYLKSHLCKHQEFPVL